MCVYVLLLLLLTLGVSDSSPFLKEDFITAQEGPPCAHLPIPDLFGLSS